MRHFSLEAVLLIASCASAYENTSPFYLYSTSNFEIPSIKDVSSASSVESITSHFLSQCPTKNYIIVSQPGVSAHDFTNAATSLPSLRQLQQQDTSSTLTVRDVIGTVSTLAIDDGFRAACNIESIHVLDGEFIPELPVTDDKARKIVHISFPSLNEDLTSDDRVALLRQHDLYLSLVLSEYFHNEDYTLAYTTSSRAAAKIAQAKEYTMDDGVPVAPIEHQDLKRELGLKLARRADNSSSSNQTIVDGPLFDKYQFLSPGIFMGGLVFILLLLILYVGFAALMSLQVTYGAFDKEQGQLAAKKQQ